MVRPRYLLIPAALAALALSGCVAYPYGPYAGGYYGGGYYAPVPPVVVGVGPGWRHWR